MGLYSCLRVRADLACRARGLAVSLQTKGRMTWEGPQNTDLRALTNAVTTKPGRLCFRPRLRRGSAITGPPTYLACPSSHPTMGQRAETTLDVSRDVWTKRVIRLGLPGKKLLNGTPPASTLSEVKLRGDAAALCLPCAAGFGGSGLRDLMRVQGCLGSRDVWGSFAFAFVAYSAVRLFPTDSPSS